MKKWKRLLSLILVSCFLVVNLPVTVFAQMADEYHNWPRELMEELKPVSQGVAEVASGAASGSGIGAYWTFYNDGTITFYGWSAESKEGIYESFYSYHLPEIDKADIKSIIIGPGVSRIDDRAFQDLTNLTEVTFLSNNLTNIGKRAFYNCDNIKSIAIPESVKVIGEEAFSSCEKLSSILIYGNGLMLDNNVFYDTAYYLDETNWSNDVLYVGDHLIKARPNATDDCITSGTLSVGSHAFYGNKNLTHLILPDSLTHIADYSFARCPMLESVSISRGLVHIDALAFVEDTALSDIYFGGTEEEWKNALKSSGTVYTGRATTAFGWLLSDDYHIHFDNSDDVGGGQTIADEYIIERVKEYTNDEFYAQYEAIRTGSGDKGQQLLELFAQYGFLDPREGIAYLSRVGPERRAYLALIDDDWFTATITEDWLNNTARGKVARVSLLGAGLVFNGEINTWLNPLTYVGAVDFPGVKKYKDMLYDYMSASSLKIEIMEDLTLVRKIASNTTDATKLYADNLIKKLNACKSSYERSQILNSAETKEIILNAKYSGADISTFKTTIVMDENSGFGKFSKAMGLATKTLSFVDFGVDSITDLFELNGKLAVYSEYRNFLLEVATSSDLPPEMSFAAYEILKEIDDGLFGKIINIGIKLIEQTGVTNILKDDFLNIIIGETGYASFNEYLLVINITSFCINQIVDVGAIARGMSYVEGYAVLSRHYAQKLKNSESVFKQTPTAENAWKFFENYNILYNLRYKGEEAVLKMHNFKGAINIVTDFGYAEKKDVVEEILRVLENCEFALPENINIPDSIQYVSKSVISCPVNVEVYAPDGELVATLIDGAESDVTNEYGRFAVVYRSYTGSYAKVICMSQEGDCTFKAIGTDDGLVGFEMATIADNETVETYSFSNVPISEGTVFTISTDEVISSQTFDVDFDRDGTAERQETLRKEDEDNYVAVSGLEIGDTSLSLSVGESALLTVAVEPSNATKQNVLWISSDDEVVNVTDGKTTALTNGEATVYCISLDNSEIISTCDVTVTKNTVAISTLTAANATCDGTPKRGYTGTPTSAYTGSYEISYVGRNDTTYGSTTPPTNAGDYTVTISVPDDDTTYTGSISLNFTINKGIQSAPAAPEIDNKTHNSVTLKAIDANANGAVAQYSKDSGATWQSEPVFAGLTAGTEYSFAVRYTGSANYEASPASTVLKVTTDAEPASTPSPTPSTPVTPVTPAPSEEPSEEPSPAPTEEPTQEIAFTDVAENAYYADAVRWAVAKGITVGTSATTFSPNADCTRGQIVTFLWRAAGSPEPASADNPFTDIKETDYFYKAVLWAVENNITYGTSSTTFGPDAPCTRAQSVTFLWRAEKTPAASSDSDFADVSDGQYYTQAVAWAVEHDITEGTGDNKFSPEDTCTRGRIVTFLYRDMGQQ